MVTTPVFKRLLIIAPFLLATTASAFDVSTSPKHAADSVVILEDTNLAKLVIDPADYRVVKLAAGFFAEDLQRVTQKKFAVLEQVSDAEHVIIAGTLGHSEVIDKLAAAGKLKDLDKIKGKWETTLCQIVENPADGVERAFVIVGSDRRGTAYGLMQLSEKIGVSPWYWWADVPPSHSNSLAVLCPAPETDAPAVKYRGIFINDEDWGLHQWASKTFEPENKGIGPKTYEKVFELMLRLRLNYLWPAMHSVTQEFHNNPENIELADRFAIVAGASHCEPMLYNNAKWDRKTLGEWDYTTNREKIHSLWEQSAKSRGEKEAVWTIGIRGVHDEGMRGPKDVNERIKIVSEVFKDQRELLDQYVTKQWGPIAQCFVPYKEVLPLYDAGLAVPEHVTLVWVDDNFGYIRRFSSPKERQRPGGAGVYWHLSYYGGPHSYTWINSTAPALMWEELHKAWENDARTLWVINVGDIKPAEIGIDYFSRLAWNPEAQRADTQPRFLKAFAEETFGDVLSQQIADLLARYYRLGTVRKPELMSREWAMSLPSDQLMQLGGEYRLLLRDEQALDFKISADEKDAYLQLVGFPVRVLAATGEIFIADWFAQNGGDPLGHADDVETWRTFLEEQVEQYNNIAGGKWKHMMPGLVTGKNINSWSSQVRWPWGDDPNKPVQKIEQPIRNWRDAATADRQTSSGNAKWISVAGLGQSARAVALKPAKLTSMWKEDDRTAPSLEFEFETKAGDSDALIDFLPTFRIYPGMQLRVAVSIDGQPPTIVEVPGSSGKEDENGPNRKNGIQNNFVRAQVPFPGLSAGKHVLRISAIDPGAVIDRISLPTKE